MSAESERLADEATERLVNEYSSQEDPVPLFDPPPNRREFLKYQDHETHKRECRARQDDNVGLVQYLMRNNKTHYKPTVEARAARHDLIVDMCMILSASSKTLVNAHIDGDFVATYFQRTHLYNIVNWMSSRRILNHPLIYRLTVAKAEGRSHTKTEVLRALALMAAYVSGDRRAILTIDKEPGNIGKWFLDDRGVHKSVFTIFIEHTRRRMRQFDAGDKIPPFFVVGQTSTPHARENTHATGRTNYLLTTFTAALNHYQSADDQYDQYFNPLWLCTQPTHIEAGEILFELLGGGLVAFGAGFTHYEAGRENRTVVNNIPDEFWHGGLEFVMGNGGRTENRLNAEAAKSQMLMTLLGNQEDFFEGETIIDKVEDHQEKYGDGTFEIWELEDHQVRCRKKEYPRHLTKNQSIWLKHTIALNDYIEKRSLLPAEQVQLAQKINKGHKEWADLKAGIDSGKLAAEMVKHKNEIDKTKRQAEKDAKDLATKHQVELDELRARHDDEKQAWEGALEVKVEERVLGARLTEKAEQLRRDTLSVEDLLNTLEIAKGWDNAPSQD